MFGHIDSSHTVASLCRRTFCFTAWYLVPVGKRARNQSGLRPAGTALALVPAFCPFLIARVPLGLTTLLPVTTGICLTLLLMTTAGLLRIERHDNRLPAANGSTPYDIGYRPARQPPAFTPNFLPTST